MENKMSVIQVNFQTKKEIKHISVCEEMGQKRPSNPTITFKVAHGGKYYLTTDLELKGRGIRQSGDGSDHAKGKKTYFATELAFNKLQEKYDTCYIDLLD